MSVSCLTALTRQLAVTSFLRSASTTRATTNHLLMRRCCLASNTKGNKSESLQHQEWLKFQKSIAVEGFETGQGMAAPKKRGGKVARKKNRNTKLEAKLAERQRLIGLGGGEYPPLRYDDEETERLLAQAYAAIPERAGPRGTRNRKRQGRRWHLVRQVRKKYKRHMAEFQTRKMEKRSKKFKDVKAALAEAPLIQERDRKYQAHVLQRWFETMSLGNGIAKSESASLEEEDKNKIKSTSGSAA